MIMPELAIPATMFAVVALTTPADTSESKTVFRKEVPSNDSPSANAWSMDTVAYPRPVSNATANTDRMNNILFFLSPR